MSRAHAFPVGREQAVMVNGRPAEVSEPADRPLDEPPTPRAARTAAMLGRRGHLVVGITLCLMVSYAWGQEAPTRGTGTQSPTPATEPTPIPPSPTTPIASYPLELLGLLAPPAQQGGVTLTPSISVSEEYNDNIFASNQNRQSDFITTFAPAIALSINRPTYELRAGYSFGADIYARETRFNEALARQNFLANGLLRATPTLTLSVSESFAYNRDTLLATQQAFSTGRQQSWSNVFTPGMTWQTTARDLLSLRATYGVIRFLGNGSGTDSDTYGFESIFTHAFTPRLAGSVGYAFTYLNLDAPGQDNATSHNPTLGISYQLTRTLTAAIRGGPAITTVGGDTFLTPAGTASLVQMLPFGSASLQYARSVATAGGFGGTNDTQVASGTLTVSTLLRGLIIVLNPSYTIAETIGPRQNGQGDLQTFNLVLGASYQIARFTTIFGGYTFFRQRPQGSSAASSATQVDVDQNRVRFGLQFGYPFHFD